MTQLDILNLFSDLSVKDKVFAFESEMKKQPQVNLSVKHHFSYGIYARELFIPEGVILTGEIHKYPQLNILLEGEISVLVDNEVKRIEAPFVICSPAGTKRIALAHSNVRWLTVHGTDETDIDKIKEKFIAKDEKDYLEFIGQLRLNYDPVS